MGCICVESALLVDLSAACLSAMREALRLIVENVLGCRPCWSDEARISTSNERVRKMRCICGICVRAGRTRMCARSVVDVLQVMELTEEEMSS